MLIFQKIKENNVIFVKKKGEGDANFMINKKLPGGGEETEILSNLQKRCKFCQKKITKPMQIFSNLQKRSTFSQKK